MSIYFKIFAICFMSMLSGCQTQIPLYNSGNPDGKALSQRIDAENPKNIRERFGVLSQLVGQRFVSYKDEYYAGHPVVIAYSWVVPGVSINFSKTYVHTLRFQFNPDRGDLDIASDFLDGNKHFANHPKYSGILLGTGKPLSDSPKMVGTISGNAIVHEYNSSAGTVTLIRNGVQSVYHRISAEDEARMWNEHRASKAEASKEFWGNVASGLAVISQAASQASAEQAALAASRQRNIPTVQEALAASEARSAQNQARHQPAAPDQYSQSLQAQTVEIQRLERQRLAQERRYQQQVAAAVPRPQVAQERPAQTAPVVRRSTYPEAVTVCTKPSGPKQSFECRSPLNVQRGHADDISGHRTPEELASGEACPDMRRLASPTHLVWGCGFGATGNSNSMDRGTGIVIEGRQTFYCSDKETSCRRTSSD